MLCMFYKITNFNLLQNVNLDITFTMGNVLLIVRSKHMRIMMVYVLIVIIHVINVMDQMIISVQLVGEMQI